MGDNLTIAHILCSRLCHDIIAPLSAISTGLELLEEQGDFENNEIFPLLKTSISTANQKLSLFRLVFGHGNLNSIITFEHLIEKLKGSLDLTKFDIKMEASLTIPFEASSIPLGMRLVACLVVCTTEFAPYGGHILLSAGDSPGETLNLTVKADKLTAERELLEKLTQEPHFASATPRTIYATLAVSYAQSLGYKLSLSAHTSQSLKLSLYLI